MTDKIVLYEMNEWTAVYLNGNLVRVGDSYLADEWLQDRFGVVVISDDAPMRGQYERDGVAQTLEEVSAYANERSDRLARAALMREEAMRLEAEAKDLEARR